MADLTELVERFKADATRTGAVVYQAEDGEDAVDYILKLAQEHDVRLAVKSMSAIADEIGLREHLEKAGIEVKETDIGQWLAQLAGEPPGSTTERTIEEMAQLISQETGEELAADPQVLLEAARRTLRQSYIEAGIGISEANFAIAESGTLVSIGDEGNDRLVSVLPRIHITLINRKDIVSSLGEAIVRIKSLTGSDNGNRMPSYVTYLTGRNMTGDIRGALMARAQGPEEEHIVLLGKINGQ